MNLGKAWILTEAFFHEDRRSLVSILTPRRHGRFVQEYLEQSYVDRYASVEEKLAYKKNRRSWPYEAGPIDSRYLGELRCGHEPVMWARYCHRLQLNDGVLTYTFKTFKHVDEQLRPTFGEVAETVAVKE